MKFCISIVSLATILLANLLSANSLSAQEFTRSTIPLKSGGSITSIQSQGRSVNYLNRAAPERTADARNAFNNGGRNWDVNTNPNSTSNRHETGFVQSPGSAGSFYRQAQNAAGNDDKYPYPASTRGANAGVGTGFNAQLTSAANPADSGRADFRFDRSGFGERPSGALGDTSNAAASNRVAQLPKPPTQLPPTQLPSSQLPNPATALPAAVPTFGGAANYNLGPNYANPAANYASGYQGYQPQPQAANTVPALNIQMPQTVGRNTNANCCCAPQSNCCCPPQQSPGYAAQQPAGYAGYQLQPNLGTPQLNRTNAPFSSLLSGSGRYSPLVQFRNMPPGTYLGQGIIGQPTAYVDGQAIRNLIRYVSP